MDRTKQIASLYDKIASRYAKEFYTKSDYIDEFLNLLPKNGLILDVGCGTGTDANYMSSKGFSVIGIDISGGMLKIARKRFPKIEFSKMDMRTLSFERGIFDGIFVAFSLIHIPKNDIFEILNKFYTHLKNGGIIYIAVQEGKSQELFIRESLKPNEKLFLNIFSSREIRSLTKKSGFSIIHEYARKAKPNELDFVKHFVLAKRSA